MDNKHTYVEVPHDQEPPNLDKEEREEIKQAFCQLIDRNNSEGFYLFLGISGNRLIAAARGSSQMVVSAMLADDDCLEAVNKYRGLLAGFQEKYFEVKEKLDKLAFTAGESDNSLTEFERSAFLKISKLIEKANEGGYKDRAEMRAALQVLRDDIEQYQE